MKRQQKGTERRNGSAPRAEDDTSWFRRMLTRFGVAGFIFFFLKGLIVWVLIPLGLLGWFGEC